MEVKIIGPDDEFAYPRDSEGSTFFYQTFESEDDPPSGCGHYHRTVSKAEVCQLERGRGPKGVPTVIRRLTMSLVSK